MGQAKARGSFEKRKAEGIVRLEQEAVERERLASERKRLDQERRAQLMASDPEGYQREKQQRYHRQELIALALGMAASLPLSHRRTP